MLHSRNPEYLQRIHWLGLDGLSEEEYAREIRRSTVFISRRRPKDYTRPTSNRCAADNWVGLPTP